MNNLRVIYDNAFSRANLVQPGSNAAGLTSDNLKLEDKFSVWRSAGTSQTLQLQWPTPELLGAVVMPFCNLTPTATMRVQLYRETADATPFYDATQPACNYAPPGLWEWGTLQLGVNAFSFGGGTYARMWFPIDSAKKMIIYFSDPDNPAGYLEFSSVMTGTYWSPQKNAQYGASAAPVDTSEQYRNAAGQQKVDRDIIYNKLSVPLSEMTPTDRANFWRIARGSGKTRPMLVSLFPEGDDPELEQAHQVYGRLSQLSAVTTPYFQTYASTLEIEEI